MISKCPYLNYSSTKQFWGSRLCFYDTLHAAPTLQWPFEVYLHSGWFFTTWQNCQVGLILTKLFKFYFNTYLFLWIHLCWFDWVEVKLNLTAASLDWIGSRSFFLIFSCWKCCCPLVAPANNCICIHSFSHSLMLDEAACSIYCCIYELLTELSA